ncbi:MAG TPA: NADH-quinone oxidoreductase subunit N, partial [Actinomycetota bacterium]|nr:NADH-quinone oxidoreductase subunit N [Actinomycetota bacterium]
YFYLRVIVLMFMQQPVEAVETDRSWMPQILVGVPAALVVVLGLFPGLVVGFLETAAVLQW